MTDRIISLDAAISVVMEYFPGDTIDDPKYAAGKSLVEALSALPAVVVEVNSALHARITELEVALVQSAIPMEALLIAETSFPFLASTTITRLEIALRSINEILPHTHPTGD